jgi:hypothetical protein
MATQRMRLSTGPCTAARHALWWSFGLLALPATVLSLALDEAVAQMRPLYARFDPSTNLFAIIDIDGSRTLSALEFQAFFHLENKQIPDDLWGLEDSNGDGVISLSEFSGPKEMPPAENNVVARTDAPPARGGGGARPVVSFESLDTNRDGGLVLEEIKAYFYYTFSRGVTTQKQPSFEALVLAGVPDLFYAHDTDGNGVISRTEFRDFWNRA